MHLKRWITALVCVPVLIYVIGPGPRWVFYLLLCLVSMIGLNEFLRLTMSHTPVIIRWAGYALSLMMFGVIYLRGVYLIPVVIVLMAYVPLIIMVLTCTSPERRLTGELGKLLFASVYISVPLGMLMIIDRYPRGNIWIFFLLSVTFACDTGAYYLGKLLGRHKLHKVVSPGKTWEGAIGGVLAGFIIAFLFLRISGHSKVGFSMFVLVLCMSIAGQLGDLGESMLKRNHGVKDSGHILPGHGGLLDRIDALLFSIPVLYIYLSIFVV